MSSYNPEIARGVPRYGRSTAAKKLAALKKAGKAPAPAKKAEKKVAATEKAPFKWYPTEDVSKPIPRSFARRPTKLRASLTPGTILILLAGKFKGKHAVFLKQLPSGLLLVSGPFGLNHVPVRRVNQRYVIATSTKIDSVDSKTFAGVTDCMFKKGSEAALTADAWKALQKDIDTPLIAAIKKVDGLTNYMKSRFSLGSGEYPHEMTF